MKICVCIKQVPDVNAPIQIKSGELIQDTNRMVINAYDASAVEEALVLTEEHEGEVDIVSVGPTKAKETIRKALAMGADRAFHIVTEDDADYDSAVYASILAAFLADKDYDVIACGKQSQDTDSGLAGSMLAQKLDIPYSTNAVGLEWKNEKLVVTRQGDTGQEIIELPSGCLITCSNDMNEPRIPSLKGIMQSKRKPMEVVELSSLNLDDDALTPKTTVQSYEEKPGKEPGKKVDGDPAEAAHELARLLNEEAGVL